MSDKPLFENMDEQEARYAPEQLPAGSPEAQQARVEEVDTVADENQPAESVVIPGAAAGAATGGAATGQSGPTGVGGIPAVAPVVAGEALAEQRDDETTEEGTAS